MFASVTSVALVGVEPRPVRVEAHVGGGKPAFHLVGLPDTAIREAKERVRAATLSSGFRFPDRRVTVNLAPAEIPKAGSAFDLPIALGVLAAFGAVPPAATRVVALGELALDGTVRPARGGLGAGIVAARLGRPCLLPAGSALEAAPADGADVRVVRSLAHAVAAALGDAEPEPAPAPVPAVDPGVPDLAVVRGQAVARRALEVAAAGGHHLLLSGPPGAGKTLLARCLPGILPPLTGDEMLAAAQAWSAAGRTRPDPLLPPFRSPHHSATPAAVVGGGSGVPVPGEMTLAHHGVLFLDELGEFRPQLLDTLRQPIEEGVVHIARKGISVDFPCDVQVVAATNPCPCGFRGDRLTPCTCSPRGFERYRRRLSGPLLDRFDMQISVPRLEVEDLAGPPGEPAAAVRERVIAAREIQYRRGSLNRNLTRAQLDALPWERGAEGVLRDAVGRVGLTARGWDRVRRVARTVADLAGSGPVAEPHVSRALNFRTEA